MLVSSASIPLTFQFNATEQGFRQFSANQQNKKTEDSHSRTETVDPEKSLDEQRLLQKLKIRDREVRAHELAHVSAGGQHITSGASFSFETGPDGRQYAVSGEVGIDTSAVPGDPAATLQKSQQVIRAALAPANPSAQDRRVASQAAVVAQQARLELVLQKQNSNVTSMGKNLDTFA